MTAVRTSFVLALLTALCICVSSSEAQVVSLESTTYTVTEGISQVTITVLISAPAAEYGGCFLSFEDVEAESGVDYMPIGGFVEWEAGDGSPKQVVVDITDDSEIEPTETFTATISYSMPPVTIGSPSQATISIEDNDSGGGDPYAYVDMIGGMQNRSGEWVVFAPAGDTFDVTVRYSEVPDSPVSVDWEADVAPFTGTVVFDGTDVQTVTLQLDSARGSGGAMALAEFRLIQPPAPRADSARGINFHAFNFFVAQGNLSTGTNCWGCIFYLFSNLADFGPCPFDCVLIDVCEPGLRTHARDSASKPSWWRRVVGDVVPLRTELLRRYRDEVLEGTATGQYYDAEYESFSTDAVRATLRRPMLFFRIVDAVEAWVPALEDLLDADGTSVVVSQTMVDRLNVVLDAFEEVGDPSFAAKIATEREKLQVDAMVGLSAAQVQNQIETLGGEVPTKTVTWGTLKQQYR